MLTTLYIGCVMLAGLLWAWCVVTWRLCRAASKEARRMAVERLDAKRAEVKELATEMRGRPLTAVERQELDEWMDAKFDPARLPDLKKG